LSPGKRDGLWIGLLLLGLAFAAIGCRDTQPREVPTSGSAMTAEELEALRRAPLKLLLVGSEAWAEEIKIQFEGRGEATVEPTVIDLEQWANTTQDSLETYDVLIVPPDRLLPLAAAEKLLSFPNASLEKWGHNRWMAIDRRVGRIEQKVFGISLGTPLWSVLVNLKSAKDAGDERPVPNTWSEWQAAAEQDRVNGRPIQWLEPMSDLNPAYALLRRAASMAKSQSQSDVIYSRGEGDPRLASPPFVKAMEDLKATYGPQAAELKNLSATDLVKRVQAGQIAGALVPLPRLDDVAVEGSNLQPHSPPGSTRFYNYFDQSWSNRASGVFRTQVVGLSGHIVCVLRRTRKSEAALQLVDLLVTESTAVTFAPFNETVLLSRPEQWANVSQWAGRQYSVDAADKMREITKLANDDVLGGAEFFPSLPGNRERLQSLTDAVWQVLENRKEPLAALEECQQLWVEIGKKHSPSPVTLLNRFK
jgi:hypothetical protein